MEAATEYFGARRFSPRRPKAPRYDLAILHDPDEPYPPSDERALARFVRAADTVGLGTELIGKDDYGRTAEFDALFIRQTTGVNHLTYRFARRAVAAGLVVIDDPQSIVRCANKVYLAELMERCGVRIPKTLIVHKDNMHTVAAESGPCVLKQPTGASRGASAGAQPRRARVRARAPAQRSELVIAQQFIATDFDWRVGVLSPSALRVPLPRRATTGDHQAGRLRQTQTGGDTLRVGRAAQHRAHGRAARRT